MDWIEHFFGVSPDSGSGSFEAAFGVGLIGIAALLSGVVVRWIRAERESQ